MHPEKELALIRPALYLHLPFCRGKCFYCAFNSRPVSSDDPLLADYLETLIAELRSPRCRPFLQSHILGSVYFGGGTPSILPQPLLARLVAAVLSAAHLENGFEFTAEANPEDLHRDWLQAAADLGINRLSLGVQSTAEEELQGLGRRAGRRQTLAAMERLAAGPIANWNADLICGLPGQSAAHLENSLRETAAHRPTHLSLYDLTVEEGTPLAARLAGGDLVPLPEEEALAVWSAGRDLLQKLGYRPYEISNFSRPGFACRHNQAYWHDQEYLGLGAGAHSFFNRGGKRIRRANESDPRFYLQRWRDRQDAVSMEETLTPPQAAFDYLMTALRTSRGVFFSEFSSRFPAALWPKAILKDLADEGLILAGKSALRLSSKGIVLSNEVFRRLLP